MNLNSKISIMQIDFAKGNGLIPAIIQDPNTRKVLMMGFMNQEAYQKTLDTNKVTFFSRSKNMLWTKGETSGNFLELVEIKVDCDKDTLLIYAYPQGPICHTGSDTCWNEKNKDKSYFINSLKSVIKDRKHSSSDESYTKALFNKGINKIAQKVGEEAVELLIEAKDEHNKDLFLREAADLLFHYLVLLEAKDYDLDEVIQVLIDRHKKKI